MDFSLTNTILTSWQRLNAFARLGDMLKKPDEQLNRLIDSSSQYNAWLTPENTRKAVGAIAGMLEKEQLEKWFGREVGGQKSEVGGQQSAISNQQSETEYLQSSQPTNKQIGLVLAGNIPMVGFHDILCVLASGHTALIRLSSQDQKLIPFIMQKLIEIEPGFEKYISFVDRLEGFDAVIATGSNNTSRYFEYYFGKVPHIIRKNRNSVALLTGNETTAQLKKLGHDVFDYFGLGCRNVSKLYVPKGYNFVDLFEAVEGFKAISDHHKYNNNYDYNKSIYLVNLQKHLDNGFLLLKQDERLASPLGVLYYEEYNGLDEVREKLIEMEPQIQCIVSQNGLDMPFQLTGFGQSQNPQLWDYADRVNTMGFLRNLV